MQELSFYDDDATISIVFFPHLAKKGNKCRFSGRHYSWEYSVTRALKLFGEGLVGLFD